MHVLSFIVVRKQATKEAFVHVSVEERVKTLSRSVDASLKKQKARGHGKSAVQFLSRTEMEM